LITVINKDGSFSGVQYDEIKQDIIDHHQKYGQKLVLIDRKLKVDDEGNVTELPTEDDLKNEITEVTGSNLDNRLTSAEDAILSLMMEG